ncbi:MAG: hypothetical protein FWE94_04815 [Coriobacteriia bacterium]|nr:hypothetical protein [Coriobacteriia bacterium]
MDAKALKTRFSKNLKFMLPCFIIALFVGCACGVARPLASASIHLWPGDYSRSEFGPGATVRVAGGGASITCPDGWSGYVNEYVPLPEWTHVGMADAGIRQMIVLQGPDRQSVGVNSFYHDSRIKGHIEKAKADDERLAALGGPFRDLSYDALSYLEDDCIRAVVYIYGLGKSEVTSLHIRKIDLQDGESVEEAVVRVASEVNLELR